MIADSNMCAGSRGGSVSANVGRECMNQLWNGQPGPGWQLTEYESYPTAPSWNRECGVFTSNLNFLTENLPFLPTPISPAVRRTLDELVQRNGRGRQIGWSLCAFRNGPGQSTVR